VHNLSLVSTKKKKTSTRHDDEATSASDEKTVKAKEHEPLVAQAGPTKPQRPGPQSSNRSRRPVCSPSPLLCSASSNTNWAAPPLSPHSLGVGVGAEHPILYQSTECTQPHTSGCALCGALLSDTRTWRRPCRSRSRRRRPCSRRCRGRSPSRPRPSRPQPRPSSSSPPSSPPPTTRRPPRPLSFPRPPAPPPRRLWPRRPHTRPTPAQATPTPRLPFPRALPTPPTTSPATSLPRASATAPRARRRRRLFFLTRQRTRRRTLRRTAASRRRPGTARPRRGPRAATARGTPTWTSRRCPRLRRRMDSSRTPFTVAGSGCCSPTGCRVMSSGWSASCRSATAWCTRRSTSDAGCVVLASHESLPIQKLLVGSLSVHVSMCVPDRSRALGTICSTMAY
jgi:hypothetical protein